MIVWHNRIKQVICLAVFGLYAVAAGAAGLGPDVRIGIMEGQSQASVTGAEPFVVVKDGKQWKRFGTNAAVPITFKNGTVYVNGAASKASVMIQPVDESGVIIIGGKPYRGKLEFIKSPRQWGMTVVNHVPVEQYLYGVVGKEMSPSWNPEALKAQAVAARTYAFFHKGYFQSRGFDMTDDTASQAYGGVRAESSAVQQAVNATNGEILTYGGKPIDALFFTSGGGYTENSENVWGDFVPYLRGVSDDSNKMPAYRWQVTVTAAELARKLEAAGKGVGSIRSITLSPLKKRPIAASDRGVSGRVKTVVFNGTAGSVTVKGNSFQQILGLRSTLFDFYQGNRIPEDIDSFSPNRGTVLKVNGSSPLTIVGFGWGHGLGMSQWGAQQMAQDFRGGHQNYYRYILEHYYSNTKLTKLY